MLVGIYDLKDPNGKDLAVQRVCRLDCSLAHGRLLQCPFRAIRSSIKKTETVVHL